MLDSYLIRYIFWILELEDPTHFPTTSSSTLSPPHDRPPLSSLKRQQRREMTTLHRLLQESDWDGVLERLESHATEASVPTNDDGLPLHLAVHLKAPPSVVRAVLRAFPEGARWRRENDSRLPLVTACACGMDASVEIVAELLEAYPEAARYAVYHDKLPLHIACGNGCNVEIIRLLAEAYPCALKVYDYYGNLPIHSLFLSTHRHATLRYSDEEIETSTAEVVAELLQRNPLSAHILNVSDAVLPLHAALVTSRSCRVIREMLRGETKIMHAVAAEKDGTDDLALHLFCAEFQRGTYKTEAEADVVAVLQRLIELYPQALCLPGGDGMLPLHWICSTSCSSDGNDDTTTVAVVREMLGQSPGTAALRLKNGFLPLHCACLYHANAQVIELLLQAYPIAVSMADSPKERAQLPLHLACLDPAAIDDEEDDGDDDYRPLEPFTSRGLVVAATRQQSHRPIVGTSGVRLESVLLRRQSSEQWNRNLLATVRVLWEAYPQGIATTDGFGDLPLHCAYGTTTPLVAGSCLPRMETCGMLQFLVQRYPSALYRRAWTPHPWTVMGEAAQREGPEACLKAAYPEGLHVPNADGLYPIHVACEWNYALCESVLVDGFLRLDPHCLSRREDKDGEMEGGRLALHAACDWIIHDINSIKGPDLELVRVLVAHYGAALQVSARPRLSSLTTGCSVRLLPFQLACCREASLDVLFFLLREYPEAIATT